VLDRKNGNLFLYRPESSRFDKDTIPFFNGRFNTTISISQPEVYWLFFEEDENDDGAFTAINIFLETGSVNVIVSYEDIQNYQVKGSKYNNDLYPIEKRLQLIRKNTNDIASEYSEIINIGDSLELAKLLAIADSLRTNRYQIIQARITENSDLVSAYYLWSIRNSMETEEIEMYLDPLVPQFPNSRYIVETKAFVDGTGKSQPSQNLKDYRLTTIDGNEINLYEQIKSSDLTLITFWSSRCGASDGKLTRHHKTLRGKW